MKGMIMGAENVRAILDGRKTRHSFPVKPQPQEHSEVEIGMWSPTGIDKHGMAYPKPEVWGMTFESFGFGHIGVCPRYKVGEIVYVKETWGIDTANCFNVYQGGKGKTDYEISYKAGGIKTITFEGDCEDDPHERYYDSQIGDWHSPMYMPEKYSRIHLEITDIKAQRVQDITEEDAMAEGIEKPIEERCMLAYRDYSIKEEDNEGYNWFRTAKESYASLWDSINAKKGFPWGVSPWVFAYTFKVVEG